MKGSVWDQAIVPDDAEPVGKLELCPAHFAMAKDALRVRGFGAYIIDDEEQVDGAEQMRRLMEPHAFHPLIMYQHIVYANALQKMGPITGCPICDAKASCPCGSPDCTPVVREDSWITKVADFVLDHARSIGITSVAHNAAAH
jgi:hypothetical protein